jgi:hypothetical protein
VRVQDVRRLKKTWDAYYRKAITDGLQREIPAEKTRTERRHSA